MMIVGRIINGFGMGVTSSTCPVYQAECSKPSVRGKLVVVGSLSNTAAFCLSNWMNYGLFFSGGALQWRFPLAFQLIFPLVVVSVLPFIPESPRWLLLKDRTDEALNVVARLMGKNLPVDNPHVVAEFISIQQSLREERAEAARTSMKDVFTFKDRTQNLRRLLLSCGTQLMQQFSGVNALGYYLPTLLQQSVGFDQQTARLLSACNGTSYLLAAFCCLILIDRAGRRKLMLYGSLTTGSCYLIAALCLRQAGKDPEKKYSLGAVTTAMFFLYYFCYGTSYAKVPWVYNSEINSLGWRARGAAAATGTNWICSFCVTQYTKVGINNLGWGFYLSKCLKRSLPLYSSFSFPISFPFPNVLYTQLTFTLPVFSIFCYSYFPIVFCLYPETSRRTLEDMDYIFESNPSIFVFGKPEMTQRNRPQAFVEAEVRRVEAGQKTGTETEVLAETAKDVSVVYKHLERSA